MSVFYVTGNRLDDGAVRYLASHAKFVSNFANAARWDSEQAANDALESVRAQNIVTGLYVFDGGESGEALSARERFRRDGASAVLDRLALTQRLAQSR